MVRKNTETAEGAVRDGSARRPVSSGARPQAPPDGMTITADELSLRKRYLDLGAEDERRLDQVNTLAGEYAGPVIDAFYEHLMSFEETRSFFHDHETLERVKRLQAAYFHRLTQGSYELDYALERLKIGATHERIGLAPQFYLGSYNLYLREVSDRLAEAFQQDPERARRAFLSLMKVVFLDIGLAIDTYVFQRERTIEVQQAAIRELSTPVLQVREGLLIIPIVGAIEGRRAQQLTQQLLRSIRERRARVVVLDVTGVPSVDTTVANHLVRTVEATRLMGARSIVTGLAADVAQTLAALGLSLQGVQTAGDLQSGIEAAEEMLGYRVVKDGDPP
jgi:rsbT co-antagonist protein RsbR